MTRQIAEAVPEYENAFPERLPLEGALQQDRRRAHRRSDVRSADRRRRKLGFPLILLTGDILYDQALDTRHEGFVEQVG